MSSGALEHCGEHDELGPSLHPVRTDAQPYTNTVYRILYTVVRQSSMSEGLVQVHRVRHSAQERLKTLDEL